MTKRPIAAVFGGDHRDGTPKGPYGLHGWRLRLGRRGISAMEFAIAGPILVLLAGGIYDLGFATWQTSVLNQALQAGVSHAMQNPGDTSGIQNAIADNLQTALPSIAGNAAIGVTVAGSPGTCLCMETGDASPPQCNMTTYPPCAAGIPQSYMTLSVSLSFSPLVLKTLTQTQASYALRYQ